MRIKLLAGGIGFFSAGIGVGGGAILVPALIHLHRYDFRRASSLSLATIAPISLVGGITHTLLLDERFPLLQLVAFIAAGAVGVLLGGASLRHVPTRWLTTAFSLFLCIVGLKMLTGWHLAALSLHAMDGYLPSPPILSLILFGVAVGATSSLLGVGCGLVIVPFCVYALGFNMHVAIPFSLVTMFFLTSAGAMERYRKGVLDLPTATSMIPAALAGAVAGAALSSQLPEAALRLAFGAFLLFMGSQGIAREAARLLPTPSKRLQHADRCD